MDLSMPEMPSEAATTQIRQLLPHVAVLILTALPDQDRIHAIHAGAVGYLLKDADSTDLLAEVRAAVPAV